MIYGITQSERYPFTRPGAASADFRPTVPATSYRSQNLHPWPMVLPTMHTYYPNLPKAPRDMGPGPAPRYVPPVPPPQPPTMQGAAGMMRGQRGLHPYKTARFGTFPSVAGNASNVRFRVRHAGAMIDRLLPHQG